MYCTETNKIGAFVASLPRRQIESRVLVRDLGTYPAKSPLCLSLLAGKHHNCGIHIDGSEESRDCIPLPDIDRKKKSRTILKHYPRKEQVGPSFRKRRLPRSCSLLKGVFVAALVASSFLAGIPVPEVQDISSFTNKPISNPSSFVATNPNKVCSSSRLSPGICAWAEEAPGGVACVTSICPLEFSSCLGNPACAKGLGCFVKCAVRDATLTKGSSMDEGSCQTRCMDLHQCPLLDAFTDCTLTKNKCYPALDADSRYPAFTDESRRILWQDNLWKARELDVSGKERRGDEQQSHLRRLATDLKHLFLGKWYIAAGLNPSFDTFDCQVHEFYDPLLEESRKENSNRIVVADATFSYRVNLGESDDGGDSHRSNRGLLSMFQKQGWFTKNGDKRLTVVLSSEDPAGRQVFSSGRRWGKDTFLHPRSDREVVKSGQFSKSSHSLSPRLLLTLRPDQMEYVDEWVVLGSDDGLKDGYIVLVYSGANSAWKGYGGLNIYTRNGKLPDGGAAMKIQNALDKVGVSLKDLITVDNTCASLE